VGSRTTNYATSSWEMTLRMFKGDELYGRWAETREKLCDIVVRVSALGELIDDEFEIMSNKRSLRMRKNVNGRRFQV